MGTPALMAGFCGMTESVPDNTCSWREWSSLEAIIALRYQIQDCREAASGQS